MYLAASTRSQVVTAQHGDHGFPICRIVCPDKRDKRRQPNSSALSPFQKDVTTRQPQPAHIQSSLSGEDDGTVILQRRSVACSGEGGIKARSTERQRCSAVSLHALRWSACTEMHRVVSSRIESSIFSVRSASLFTVLSCRLFRCIYTPHSGYQTFVRL